MYQVTTPAAPHWVRLLQVRGAVVVKSEGSTHTFTGDRAVLVRLDAMGLKVFAI